MWSSNVSNTLADELSKAFYTALAVELPPTPSPCRRTTVTFDQNPDSVLGSSNTLVPATTPPGPSAEHPSAEHPSAAFETAFETASETASASTPSLALLTMQRRFQTLYPTYPIPDDVVILTIMIYNKVVRNRSQTNTPTSKTRRPINRHFPPTTMSDSQSSSEESPEPPPRGRPPKNPTQPSPHSTSDRLLSL